MEHIVAPVDRSAAIPNVSRGTAAEVSPVPTSTQPCTEMPNDFQYGVAF